MSGTNTKVASLREYIGAIEAAYCEWDAFDRTTGLWFRGQADQSWGLVPGLYRRGSRVRAEFERELTRDFRLRSGAYISRPPTQGLEWLFVMQHYGMPTRLLDWTEAHLCALYFAVSTACTVTAEGAVWVLDPWSLNLNVIGVSSVPLADDELLADYSLESGGAYVVRKVKAQKPAAVRPHGTTPRIIAQKGTFTIHGNLHTGLDSIASRIKRKTPDRRIRVRKIVIDGLSKQRLLKDLYWAGVTEAVLFPDLVGLCGEISYRYSDEHLGCKPQVRRVPRLTRPRRKDNDWISRPSRPRRSSRSRRSG